MPNSTLWSWGYNAYGQTGSGDLGIHGWDEAAQEKVTLYSVEHGVRLPVRRVRVDLPAFETAGLSIEQCALDVLRHPTVASKSFLVTIGDRTVHFVMVSNDVADLVGLGHQLAAAVAQIGLGKLATQLVHLKLSELRQKWRAEGDKWPEIVWNMQSRIGLNSGSAIIGARITSSSERASVWMSSRSSGVTKVRWRRWMISWVRKSHLCSTSLISSALSQIG